SFSRDWSSDVCSSDLMIRGINAVRPGEWLRFDGSTTPQRRTFFRITDWVDPALSAELDRASEHEVLERLAGDFETSMDLRMISEIGRASCRERGEICG